MKKKLIIVLITLTIIALPTFSQVNRSIGLSGSINDENFDLLIPIWVSQNIVIAPSFGVKYAEDISTELSLGLSPKYYFENEKISPYLGFKIGMINYLPVKKNGKATTDFLGGIVLGADYFFNSHFSVGVQSQFNITDSDINSLHFGNTGNINFNTATMLIASIYL